MTLLGVRPKDSRDVLLNPGLHYILDEDDVCYYMGFTREEYSKVLETPPSAVRTALWQTCASVALLAISIAGINTEQLGPELGAEIGAEPAEGGGAGAEESKAPVSPQCSVHFQLGGVEEEEEEEEVVVEPVVSCPPSGEVSTCEVPHTESSLPVVKRGLKLLKYHSRMDVHANPVVKVHFCGQGPGDEDVDGSTFDVQPPKPVVDGTRLMEEGRSPKVLHHPIMVAPPMRQRRRSLRRSISESSLTGIMSDLQQLKARKIIYSSQLSLFKGSKAGESSRGEASIASHNHFLAKVLRRMSSWNTHHRPSVGTAVDFKGSQEVFGL